MGDQRARLSGLSPECDRSSTLFFSCVCIKMPAKLRRRPRALSSRNIKRRKGASAQSRQIMALSKSLQRMSRKQFARVHTVWQRDMLSVEAVTGGVQAYICPLPYVPCNPDGASQPGGQIPWTDNLGLAAQPAFSKKAVFGVAREAATSNEIYHTGGLLKWQMRTNEPTFSKYSLFVIRPKRAMADQLTIDRKLKQGTLLNDRAGFASFLQEDIDYIVHTEGVQGGTTFGAQINRKYWDVLYRREVALGANSTGGDRTETVNYNAPGNYAQTGLTASGSIKLPAGGMIKCANVVQQTGTGNTGQATSWEVNYAQQENSSGLFLVCINNGVSLDNENCKLGFLVHDYYKACV